MRFGGKIVNAGAYNSIAISIHCFHKFFKSPNLFCIGANTLVGLGKET